MPIGAIWQTFLETPLINMMVALTAIAFGSYGLAILTFTVLSRALLFPLTLRMLRSMRALQEIQPQMQDIQKRYSDPKRRNEEVMKLYRDAGVNPLGCLGPQLLQMPLFIALYQVIRITLGNTPEGILNLSGRLYDVNFIQDAVPLSRTFLGMDLGENGSFILVAIVFAAMWLQQRISTSRNASTAGSQGANQQQMSAMMQWMMPMLFSWFVFISPAGLGVYWFASTAIGIILQWAFVGPGDFTWGSLVPAPFRDSLGIELPEPGTRRGSHPPARRVARNDSTSSKNGANASDEADDADSDSGDSNASNRNQRSDGGRGDRARPGSAGRRSGSGRRRRRNRR